MGIILGDDEKFYSALSRQAQDETPALEAESVVQAHVNQSGWAGSVGAFLLGAVAGIVGIVVVLFAGIKLFGWLYDTFGGV